MYRWTYLLHLNTIYSSRFLFLPLNLPKARLPRLPAARTSTSVLLEHFHWPSPRWLEHVLPTSRQAKPRRKREVPSAKQLGEWKEVWVMYHVSCIYLWKYLRKYIHMIISRCIHICWIFIIYSWVKYTYTCKYNYIFNYVYRIQPFFWE